VTQIPHSTLDITKFTHENINILGEVGYEYRDPVFLSDNKIAVLYDDIFSYVSVFDVNLALESRRFSLKGNCHNIKKVKDSRIACSYTNETKIWNCDKSKCEHELAHNGIAQDIIPLSESKLALLINDGENFRITFWDIVTGLVKDVGLPKCDKQNNKLILINDDEIVLFSDDFSYVHDSCYKDKIHDEYYEHGFIIVNIHKGNIVKKIPLKKTLRRTKVGSISSLACSDKKFCINYIFLQDDFKTITCHYTFKCCKQHSSKGADLEAVNIINLTNGAQEVIEGIDSTGKCMFNTQLIMNWKDREIEFLDSESLSCVRKCTVLEPADAELKSGVFRILKNSTVCFCGITNRTGGERSKILILKLMN